MGLKTCPFNSSHRIRASSYEKHVFKCEQQFPKTLNRCSDGLSSRRTISTSIESFFENNSEISDKIDGLTNALTEFTLSEDWTEEVNQIPVPLSVELWKTQSLDSRGAESSDRSGSPDSAIGMASDSNSCPNVIKTEVEVHSDVNDLDSTLTQPSAQTQSTDNSQPTERLTDRSPDRSRAVPIAPQQVEIIPEPSNTCNQTDEGSGDPNDWTSGEPYSLYAGYENMDDLTDEQIMEMADSFLDVVVLSKMNKSQRKELNDKLIQLKKAEKQRKQKAFDQLITYTDVWDPEINAIPQEIRKPRVDVRQLFNLNKKQNKRIDTLKSNTHISPEPNECPPNPWTYDESSKAQPFRSDVQCVSSKNECSTNSEDSHLLSAVCNNCWDPLALTEENIKQMTLFCATCSGIKFGGYFECQSCKLYGYFANSQISQHLTKHFPQTN